MFKIRLALLGVLALFVVSGIGASTASASGGPFWHVNGSKLTQGARQLNLQNKGAVVLKGEVTSLKVIVECATSASEGATIEGSGAQKPGQDKGRLSFEKCKTTLAGNTGLCKVVEPIVTNQTKSILATSSESGQSKYVDLFEPQQGTTFANLSFVDNEKTCSIKTGNPFPVKGSVAAELVPKESEVQEGLLNFPEKTIKTVYIFNQPTNQPEEKTGVGLFLGVNPAVFSGAYSGKLATGERWGVFST